MVQTAFDSKYDAIYHKPLKYNQATGMFDVELEDLDTEFSYNHDGTIAQIQASTAGKTKTTIFTWLNGALQSVATIIT